jgi:hypothetical protein
MARTRKHHKTKTTSAHHPGSTVISNGNESKDTREERGVASRRQRKTRRRSDAARRPAVREKFRSRLGDPNAHGDVFATLRAVSHIGVGADSELARYGRVVIDRKRHALARSTGRRTLELLPGGAARRRGSRQRKSLAGNSGNLTRHRLQLLLLALRRAIARRGLCSCVRRNHCCRARKQRGRENRKGDLLNSIHGFFQTSKDLQPRESQKQVACPFRKMRANFANAFDCNIAASSFITEIVNPTGFRLQIFPGVRRFLQAVRQAGHTGFPVVCWRSVLRL